jgi:hypothetical protein
MIFSAEGVPGITIETEPAELELGGGQIMSIAARVSAPRASLAAGGQDIIISAQAADDDQLRTKGEARFIAPSAQ